MTLKVARKIIDQDLIESSVNPASLEGETAPTSIRRVVVSAMIGNALEWYDFALYGYFATLIGRLFFPSADPMASLILTYGVFAAGFIMRPLGALFFGQMGDKVGRKQALMWSIYLMAVPTACIGLLPTFAQVGIIAPLLLITIRLLQGFSVGGEFTGSMVFIIEHASHKGRGFAGSCASFSLLVGLIMGSGTAALFTHFLSQPDLESWGWRVPFLLSVIGGAVGSYMRRKLADPKAYEDAKKAQKLNASPIKELFSNHKWDIGRVIAIDMLLAVGFYMVVTFISGYMNTVLKIPQESVLVINTISMVIFAAFIPLSGWMSDRVGRKPVMMVVTLGLIALSYPSFSLICQGGFWMPLLGQGILSVFMGTYFGVIPAVISEQFPTSVRFSGLSISHNLSMSVFGGSVPWLMTQAIQTTDNLMVPAFYLIFAACISLLSLSRFKDRYKENLN